MRSNFFFPTAEPEQAVWLSNYLAKLPIHAAACGIGTAELTNSVVDLNYAIWLLQEWHPAVQNDARGATAYKLLMINGGDNASRPQASSFPNPPAEPAPGILKRLFSQIARIKVSPAYNEAIGHDLGLIATSTTAEHPVPEFTVTVELGAAGPRVRIDFRKYGHDGIWIESRRNGGEWAFLCVHTVKPYLDERPLADGKAFEAREYRLRWWDKSAPHGEWSAVHKAVLGS